MFKQQLVRISLDRPTPGETAGEGLDCLAPLNVEPACYPSTECWSCPPVGRSVGCWFLTSLDRPA